MSDNAGADLLKIIVKIILWIIKLLPSLIKLIIKGIKSIINSFKKKGNIEESPAKK
ncbi:MAG: hypothetical protein K9N09_06930 [Candidatus Cloacimonetes bacterium]|nr:hypothetical protein [Candidatus Cloacimonadota bacterium]MCF7815223.1 hypothetical protein [Candidatus Cloacimonadota bacterium]MCF7868418.1 hypothetical protein [Candidatus Cloacimonadota bacterium]MCF7883891.1 hypothetical protein [Candidatus Cloacimonadota bacterium]